MCKVWFRRGVNSHNPCGSGWITIGGEMMMVNVGLNDQVKNANIYMAFYKVIGLVKYLYFHFIFTATIISSISCF